MTLYASRFQLAMLAGLGNVVRFGADDYGLYHRQHRNAFGTSLMARGTEAELDALREGRA
jgi:hypothetical protein